jgi:hypothetical protein
MAAKTKSNVLKEAGGALAGMLAGNAVGKMVGVGAGGLIGAAGGFLIAKNSRENMTVAAGSVVNVELQAARRQAP